MLKLRINAITDSAKSKIKGAVNPLVALSKAEQAVATNEAIVRLKFIMLKLVGKCFVP